jgi:signal transduction histidine kinase
MAESRQFDTDREKRMSLLTTHSNGSSNGASHPDGNGDGSAQRFAKSSVATTPGAERIAIISHELRNSLGVVGNAARMLRSPVDIALIERARTLIERHVTQMNLHIEHLLDPDAGNRRNDALLLSFVDLRTILENAVDAIAVDCARRGHRLVVNLPADALRVHADAARLEQAFLNLLINAAKFTPGGGEIVLTMERLGTHASVRIRDSGIGIAPEQLSRIFEMSVQVDAKALPAEGGHGIGLAVVRDLVEMHGGTVCAASPGLTLGSEFRVLLPAPWA